MIPCLICFRAGKVTSSEYISKDVFEIRSIKIRRTFHQKLIERKHISEKNFSSGLISNVLRGALK